jgi:hypothetical protein
MGKQEMNSTGGINGLFKPHFSRGGGLITGHFEKTAVLLKFYIMILHKNTGFSEFCF